MSSLHQSPDVIVIGAGLAGSSVAWHLAAHARITVLEQGTAPGMEASAQNAGLVRRMVEDPVDRALARRTQEFLTHGPWPEVSHTTGAVFGLVHDALHLHGARAHLQALDIRAERLENVAGVAPILHQTPLHAAWWLPDARVADGPALVNRFILDRGIELRCNTTVTGLVVDQGRCVGVHTDQGTVHGGAVVLAGGAWCAHLAGAAGLDRPLIPLRRTIGISAPENIADHPWVWLDDAGLYLRPKAGGWLFCAGDELVQQPPVGPGSAGLPLPSQKTLLQDRVRGLIPPLAGSKITEWWTGLRTFAPDRRPLLGPDKGLPGLWWAAGLGGAGLSGCVGVGEAVSAWMAGRTVDWLDQNTVAPDRPQLRRWPIFPEGTPDSARLIQA